MQIKKFVNLLVVFGLLIFLINCNPFAPQNDSPVTVKPLNIKDSIAVRHILDANGLDSIKVRDVISIGTSEVDYINLNSLSLKQIIFNNYLDSFYSEAPTIYLEHNNIDTIIITDSIVHSFFLLLGNNKLRTIPDDIGKFKGGFSIHLDSNQLTSISSQIIKCTVYDIYINNNKLCNLPDSISQWVTKATKDSTWLSTQACR